MIDTRILNTKHANELANLHYMAFKGFFLTSLGKPFLLAFYKAIMLNKNGICIGAFEGDKLIGFAAGCTNNAGFYKNLIKRNFVSMILAAVPSLILKPANIKRLLNSLRSSNTNNKASLLSICVSPHEEGKGVGKKLLNAFEKELLEKGCKELILTTDTIHNNYANEFYLRNNYLLKNTFFQAERKMNLYIKNLTR